MNALNSEIIFAAAGRPGVIGAEGEIVHQVASTMDLAIEKAARGAPDGYVILAERQTRGRGRTGAWESGAGESILVSVILRAGFRASERKLVGIMGAVSAAEALQCAGVKALIKWPNDVVVARPTANSLNLKKLGGVIVEQFHRGDSAPAHVLGIGININQDITRLPDTVPIPSASARTELGRMVNRNQVCISLLRQLDTWYKTLQLGKP